MVYTNIGLFGFFGFMFMIIFVTASIFLIVWFVQKAIKPLDKTSLEILKERFAKGELSKKEFFEMKSELKTE